MLLAAVVLGTGPVSISAAVPRTRERHAAVQPQRYPVPLNDVRITGGPFLHAQEMDRRWLDAMDPDRYLSGFRSEAGLEDRKRHPATAAGRAPDVRATGSGIFCRRPR